MNKYSTIPADRRGGALVVSWIRYAAPHTPGSLRAPIAAAAPPDRVDWEAFIPSQTEDTSELDSGDFIRSATGIA